MIRAEDPDAGRRDAEGNKIRKDYKTLKANMTLVLAVQKIDAETLPRTMQECGIRIFHCVLPV